MILSSLLVCMCCSFSWAKELDLIRAVREEEDMSSLSSSSPSSSRLLLDSGAQQECLQSKDQQFGDLTGKSWSKKRKGKLIQLGRDWRKNQVPSLKWYFWFKLTSKKTDISDWSHKHMQKNGLYVTKEGRFTVRLFTMMP